MRISELDYVLPSTKVRSAPVNNQVVQDGDQVENDEETHEDNQRNRPLARALRVELFVVKLTRGDFQQYNLLYFYSFMYSRFQNKKIKKICLRKG